MKTKRKPREAQTTILDPEAADRDVQMDPATQSPAQSNGYKPGSKLQVSLKDDGSIDWEAMRDSTREKVKQAFRSTPGLNDGPAAQPPIQMFNPAMVSGMYDMLGSIEATVAERFGKIPQPIAQRVFAYTPAEKEMLAGPTARVLNKYIPDWMIKYQDEIALASTLIAITNAKVNAAITLARMSQANITEIPKKEEGEPVAPN
jgi:hypothetical protein